MAIPFVVFRPSLIYVWFVSGSTAAQLVVADDVDVGDSFHFSIIGGTGQVGWLFFGISA